MISPQKFVEALHEINIHFVTGVPDSLLKEVCACITASLDNNQHIIASNEGAAIALAIGHYLGSQSPSLVYMQNSGMGNTINPLASLADKAIYSIPMILMIGWRGEILDDGSQLQDEPQHVKQGEITLELLKTMEIPYQIIDKNSNDISSILANAKEETVRRQSPVAIVVRKGTFEDFKSGEFCYVQDYELAREQAIEITLELLPEGSPIVSTTGMISRELYELRQLKSTSKLLDFLTVGGMGHASSIAAGICIARPNEKVICIDGDGALLMHSGALSNTSNQDNLLHILLNNEAHDSVGGQPTKGNEINFHSLAKTFGYKNTFLCFSKEDIEKSIIQALNTKGSTFIEIKCRKGFRQDLGRPQTSPLENKLNFLKSMHKL
jgi:phosphonopyruvate decarboxylase|tara:strand:- start:482 stop:1624 length:1143 start_codon:yes stop_codon:yes gene_type:complete